MKAALKRGVETGVLVQVKASYKLSAEAKKPAPKKKAVVKKTTAVKKSAPKKKVSYWSCCLVYYYLAYSSSLGTRSTHISPYQATATKKTATKVRILYNYWNHPLRPCPSSSSYLGFIIYSTLTTEDGNQKGTRRQKSHGYQEDGNQKGQACRQESGQGQENHYQGQARRRQENHYQKGAQEGCRQTVDLSFCSSCVWEKEFLL
jgi:hypothetical protein